MTLARFDRPARLRGIVQVLGDKSISHRALLLAALADRPTRISGLSTGGDVASTAACLRELGVGIAPAGPDTIVTPPARWRPPAVTLDCGNSGTSMRLLTGALAGQEGLQATLVGDQSLSRRPMARVAQPLALLGADIALSANGTAPLQVRGQALRGAKVELAVASAQVKSAVLLAGLCATDETWLREPLPSRDHTERLLIAMAADLAQVGDAWRIRPTKLRSLGTLAVPGDPSSAAFLVAAAALHSDAQLGVPAVCVNPLRMAWFDVLQRMGAAVEVGEVTTLGGEPTAGLLARSSALRAVTVDAREIPSLIDEVPILALCAAAAQGDSVFCGVAELRLKESDRLAATIDLLGMLGVQAWAQGDDLHVRGAGSPRHWAPPAQPYHPGLDHRMAMTAAVAGLVGPAPVVIANARVIDTSWPGFAERIQQAAAYRTP